MSQHSEAIKHAPSSQDLAEHTKPLPCKEGSTGVYHSMRGGIVCNAQVLHVYSVGQVRLICHVDPAGEDYIADAIPIKLTMDPKDTRRWFVPGVTLDDWNALVNPMLTKADAPPDEAISDDTIPDATPAAPKVTLGKASKPSA